MAPQLTKGKKSSKNPPILSHDFIIQNHGDIVSCITMVAVAGLFLEATSPIAMIFISLQHNTSITSADTPAEGSSIFFTRGPRDFCSVFFYSLVFVVAHAIVQEYLLDKLNRRMHLSKVKHSLFNESGQLAIFFAAAAVFGCWILMKEKHMQVLSLLWLAYPHANATFWMKMFVVLQLAYWVHCYYELYFQKVKKDDILRRVKMYTIYLVIIAASYFFHYTLLFLFLATLHYAAEALFHISKLLHFAEKHSIAQFSFKVWKVVFVAVRLITITLSVIVIWYGMSKEGVGEIDWKSGNFNTPHFRVASLGVIFVAQACIMWHFITFHVRKVRESRNDDEVKKTPLVAKVTAPKNKKAVKNSGDGEEGEAQQNGGTRYRSPRQTPKSK